MLTRLMRRMTGDGLRGTLVYICCRFLSIRRLHRALRSSRDHPSIEPDPNEFVILSNGGTRFSLAEDGLVTGLALTPDVTDRLTELASEATVHSLGSVRPVVYGLDEINRFNEGNRRPVCKARVTSPGYDALCGRVARNPYLLDLVRSYIGGIRKIEIRTEWSLVAEADTAWRESQNQTVMFHYDVFGLNFVYAFFYLTPCDRNSGAHELLRGSHRSKPLRLLFSSSVRQASEKLHAAYPPDMFEIIEGCAGFGFVEDTSCFHRARAPVSAPRLALQIRYA